MNSQQYIYLTFEADNFRKLLLCLLEQNKIDAANETFHFLDESARREPLTLYLGFKLALRHGSHELAAQCLEGLNEQSPNDPQYIYACCVDARSAGDKKYAAKSLEYLAAKPEFGQSSPLHFPAVLRSLIRLHMQTLSDNERADSICCDFENGEVTLLNPDSA